MRTVVACLTFASVLIPSTMFAEEAVQPSRPTISSMDQLVRMSRCELLALYANAAPGPIPHGYLPGRAIFNPGHPLTVARAKITSATMWQGKIFLDDAHVVNKVAGIPAINMSVYQSASWFDGKPSIMLDYQAAGWPFERYRDEIREVAPGLYLGLMYERKCPEPQLKLFFALDARCGCR